MEQKRLPVFAERFAELRGEMTQGEFAEFLGISRPTVGFYENGTRIPDALVLRQIAVKCQVSTDWLLGLSNFHTEAQEHEADEFYNGLVSLMAIEFDEHDKERVTRTFTFLIDGFKDALCDYEMYVYYENAVLRTSLALSSAAKCLRVAQECGDKAMSSDRRDAIFSILDDVFNEASAAAYKEIGHFFIEYKDAARESLQSSLYKLADLRFMSKLANLKESLEDSSFDETL